MLRTTNNWNCPLLFFSYSSFFLQAVDTNLGWLSWFNHFFTHLKYPQTSARPLMIYFVVQREEDMNITDITIQSFHRFQVVFGHLQTCPLPSQFVTFKLSYPNISPPSGLEHAALISAIFLSPFFFLLPHLKYYPITLFCSCFPAFGNNRGIHHLISRRRLYKHSEMMHLQRT